MVLELSKYLHYNQGEDIEIPRLYFSGPRSVQLVGIVEGDEYQLMPIEEVLSTLVGDNIRDQRKITHHLVKNTDYQEHVIEGNLPRYIGEEVQRYVLDHWDKIGLSLDRPYQNGTHQRMGVSIPSFSFDTGIDLSVLDDATPTPTTLKTESFFRGGFVPGLGYSSSEGGFFARLAPKIYVEAITADHPEIPTLAPLPRLRPSKVTSSRIKKPFPSYRQPDCSRREKNEIVLEDYISLVKFVAKRLARRLPTSVEFDELVNIGFEGLYNAAERFDHSKGVSFKTYAELRIKGQMVDALRAGDFVPRSVRRKHNRIESERRELKAHGIKPTRAAMMNRLDMNDTQYDRYVEDSHVRGLVSLDAPPSLGDSSSRIETIIEDHSKTPEELFLKLNQRDQVRTAISHLPEKERYAVMGHLDGKTLKQIGTELGVTESRACQLRSAAIKRLRYRLRHLQE